jgi:hypothetical protein
MHSVIFKQFVKLYTCKKLLAGTDKKSLMPRPKLLANPIGLPITPAEPNTCILQNYKESGQNDIKLWQHGRL